MIVILETVLGPEEILQIKKQVYKRGGELAEKGGGQNIVGRGGGAENFVDC